MANYSKFSFASSWVLLSLLLLLSATAQADNNLSPFIDNICDQVNCGRGNCSADVRRPFSFVCECDAGWRRTRLDNEDDLQFLPCVVPNCSINYSCMPAPPPSPSVPYNRSFFDPCYWTYCGEGRCTRNNTYTHTCECNPGYSNLLNITHFPCLSECAVGADCERLGVRVSSSSSSPSGGGRQSDSTRPGTNQASSFVTGGYHWIAIMVISMAMALRN